jgi:hypothetical protein
VVVVRGLCVVLNQCVVANRGPCVLLEKWCVRGTVIVRGTFQWLFGNGTRSVPDT